MASKTLHIGELEFRFNWLIAACVLVTALGFMRLGVWQMTRANEKLAIQQSFDSQRDSAPTAIENLSLAGIQTDRKRLQNRKVLLSGEYINDRNIVLIYQTYKEQLGYEIVTPFRLSSDSSIVMVSRGWSSSPSFESLAAGIKPITGAQSLTGQLYIPSEAMIDKTNDITEVSWPLLIRYLNTLELKPHFEASLFPYVVRMDENQHGVLVRHWPTVIVDTSRNYSYALQWFALAIAVVAVALILSSNLISRFKNS